MISSLKMLAVAGAIGGMAALAQPARADHVRFGIGFGVNVAPPVTTVVVPGPAYVAPVYVAPTYAAPTYVVPAYAPPVYTYTPATGYYYGAAPLYPQPYYYAEPSYYYSQPSFFLGTDLGFRFGGGRGRGGRR